MTDHPLLGVLYQHEGVYLLQDRQFEELVNPLRDYEATRLLKNSESAGDIGRILHWVGGAALVGGATGLLTGSSDQQTTFWLTSAGGALTFNIGSFFEMGARSDRFNCVQRYNRFARGEEQVLPAAEDEKSLMDLGSMKPSGTPTPTSK
jgi:hypothetical protein